MRLQSYRYNENLTIRCYLWLLTFANPSTKIIKEHICSEQTNLRIKMRPLEGFPNFNCFVGISRRREKPRRMCCVYTIPETVPTVWCHLWERLFVSHNKNLSWWWTQALEAKPTGKGDPSRNRFFSPTRFQEFRTIHCLHCSFPWTVEVKIA
jgi:hypothetical protein